MKLVYFCPFIANSINVGTSMWFIEENVELQMKKYLRIVYNA